MNPLHVFAATCAGVWAVFFVVWASRWAYKFFGFGHD